LNTCSTGWERTSKAEIEKAMQRAEDASIEQGSQPGDFTNYSFRKSKDIPGLQCVDAISWVCYQVALFAILDKPTHQFATIGWNDFGGDQAPNGWLRASTILPGDLKKWMDEVMANPENLEKLKLLQEKQRNRERKNLAHFG